MNLLSLGYGLSSRPSIAGVGLTVSGHTGGVANIGDTLTPSVDGASVLNNEYDTGLTGAYTPTADDVGRLIRFKSGSSKSERVLVEHDWVECQDNFFNDASLVTQTSAGNDLWVPNIDVATGETFTFNNADNPNDTIRQASPIAHTGSLRVRGDVADPIDRYLTLGTDVDSTLSFLSVAVSMFFGSGSNSLRFRMDWWDGSAVVGDPIVNVNNTVAGETTVVNIVNQRLEPPVGATQIRIRINSNDWSLGSTKIWRFKIGSPSYYTFPRAARSMTRIPMLEGYADLSAAASVSFDVNGFPLIHGSASISAAYPVSEDVDGYVAYGAMKNVYLSDSGGDGQGFDEMLSVAFGNNQLSQNPSYTGGNNVHPTVGGAVAMTAGDVVTFSYRLPGAAPNQWTTLRDMDDIGCTASAWAPGQTIPARAGTTDDVAPIDGIERMGSLSRPTGVLTAAQTLAQMPRTYNYLGPIGEGFGRFNPEAFHGELSGYPGNMARTQLLNSMWLAVHIDDEDQGTLCYQTAKRGKDLYAMRQLGWAPSRGEAQHSEGRAPDLINAAKLFGSTDMETSGLAMSDFMKQAQFFVEEQVGLPLTEWPQDPGSTYQWGVLGRDVGRPFFMSEFQYTAGQISTHWSDRYLFLCATGQQGGFLSLIMGDSPSGGTMEAKFLEGAAPGDDNPRGQATAILPWLDRFHVAPDGYGSPSRDAGAVAAWNAWRGLLATPIDDFAPLRPPGHVSADETIAAGQSYFNGGNGQITIKDSTSLSLSNLPVTQQDIRLSLDRVQWVEHYDIPRSGGSVTGLMRSAEYYAAFRMVNSAGNGDWSSTEPNAASADENEFQNLVTTAGSEAAAAPSNTVLPGIFMRKYPAVENVSNVELTGTVDLDDITNLDLTAGLGDWQGFPAPTYAYDWIRAGSALGNNAKTRKLVAADFGGTLAARVSATNATGTVDADSAAITLPALPSIPAGTICDITGRAVDQLVYSGADASITTSDAFMSIRGDINTRRSGGNSLGVIQMQANGSSARAAINVAADVPLTPGTTYSYTITVFPRLFGGWSYPFRVRLGNTAYSPMWADQTLAKDTERSVQTFNGTFTPSSGQTAAWFTMGFENDAVSVTKEFGHARIQITEV